MPWLLQHLAGLLGLILGALLARTAVLQHPELLPTGQNCINHAVSLGLFGAHPEVPLHVLTETIHIPIRVGRYDLDLLLLEMQNLAGLDLDRSEEHTSEL